MHSFHELYDICTSAVIQASNKNLWGWIRSYISEEISKMVGPFSENKAFGISVNKLGGDICTRIWETMHLINNFLVLNQRI